MARRISRTSKKGKSEQWLYEVTVALPWKPLSRFLADEALPGYWDAKAAYAAPWLQRSAWVSDAPKQVFLTDPKTAVMLKMRFG